jgi:hypothetical protein
MFKFIKDFIKWYLSNPGCIGSCHQGRRPCDCKIKGE